MKQRVEIDIGETRGKIAVSRLVLDEALSVTLLGSLTLILLGVLLAGV